MEAPILLHTSQSQTLHACHICLHWGGSRGQCRHIWQSHGSCLQDWWNHLESSFSTLLSGWRLSARAAGPTRSAAAGALLGAYAVPKPSPAKRSSELVAGTWHWAVLCFLDFSNCILGFANYFPTHQASGQDTVGCSRSWRPTRSQFSSWHQLLRCSQPLSPEGGRTRQVQRNGQKRTLPRAVGMGGFGGGIELRKTRNPLSQASIYSCTWNTN